MFLGEGKFVLTVQDVGRVLWGIEDHCLSLARFLCCLFVATLCIPETFLFGRFAVLIITDLNNMYYGEV